tara:strand:+ start:2714 stop:2851 length:138 start_codon:yes stop_codon:yes gene_type:complete
MLGMKAVVEATRTKAIIIFMNIFLSLVFGFAVSEVGKDRFRDLGI